MPDDRQGAEGGDGGIVIGLSDENRRQARELVMAHWTDHRRVTPESQKVYEDALARATEDAETALDVMHALCVLVILSILEDVGHDLALVEERLQNLFRTQESLKPTPD